MKAEQPFRYIKGMFDYDKVWYRAIVLTIQLYKLAVWKEVFARIGWVCLQSAKCPFADQNIINNCGRFD